MNRVVDNRRAGPIRTLSLFSGAGGLDIGFHEAGYKIVAAVEIEPAYAATLSANRGRGKVFGPDLQVHCIDIRDFDPTEYVGQGIECVIGGPPCQTFSAAGRRSGGVLGTDDERGQLFRAYVEILSVLQPSTFVFENVYGLPGANGGEPWRDIVDAFAGVGYQLHFEVLDAADYGVPQHRERLILVGTRHGSFIFPRPTHGPDSSSGLPLVSAAEVLTDLDAMPRSESGIGGLYGHLLPQVPPGLNYSFFTREMGHPAPQFAWRSKFHDFLYKADPSSPVRTIKSKPGKFTGPFHWDNRHFTSAELKRLQSFPDEYTLVGSANKVLEQIGNSVPPRLAFVVATSVKEQILRPRENLTFATRAPDFKSTFRQRQRERNLHFHSVAKSVLSAADVERVSPPQLSLIERQTYYAGFDGWFNRLFTSDRPSRKSHELVLRVDTSRRQNRLRIGIRSLFSERPPEVRVKITITGLAKYMDHTNVVEVTAKVASEKDLFAIWVVIERELVGQSRFFSLIDIYGHYANRGDTVEIKTEVMGRDSELIRATNFFGDSQRCGEVMSIESVAKALSVRAQDVPSCIDALRSVRWDVRVRETHRTLSAGSVLCTYPFPTLSEKAHFEKGSAMGPDFNSTAVDVAV